MWILFRLVMTVITVGYRFYGMGFLRSGFQSYPGDLSIKVVNKPPSKNGQRKSVVFLRVRSGVFFRLVKENIWLSYLKAAGFDREVQVGVKEFDEVFYIATENAGIIQKLRVDAGFRDVLLKLNAAGYEKIIVDGFGHVKLEKPSDHTYETDEFFAQLSSLKRGVESIERSSFLAEPFVLKVLILELICFAISGYALASYISLKIEGGQIHLDLRDLITKGLLMGLVLIATWYFFVWLFLRRSSRLPLILYDFSIPVCLTALVSGFQLFSDLNRSLDVTPISVVQAVLVEKYSEVVGSGRSRRTVYYLHIRFKDNMGLIPSRLDVSSWTYNDLTEGEGVEFRVRQGYFQSPYIEDIKPVPLSWKISSNNGDFSALDMNLAQKLAKWKPSQDSQEVVNGVVRWSTVKYRSGKLRQKEPLINGRKNGLAYYWFENGKEYAVIPWYEDQKHGRYRTHTSDGVLEQSLSFRYDKPHGLLSWYGKDGKVSTRALYDNGVHVQADQSVLDTLAREINEP